MLVIDCPYCGPRESVEFTYGGDASLIRPNDPEATSDTAWADYLFIRANPKGLHLERGFIATGVRYAWIKARR